MKKSLAILFSLLIFSSCSQPSGEEATKEDKHHGHGHPSGAPEQLPPPEDCSAPPKDAIKTASGFYYKIEKPGKGGDKPGKFDSVSVHYTVWKASGKMLFTSKHGKNPVKKNVHRIIPGWSEAMQNMTVGEKRLLWLPEKNAFQGRPGLPKGILVLEVELFEIFKTYYIPDDLEKPPKDAVTTASGLTYKILKDGDGAKKPDDNDIALVIYTGWLTDGRRFENAGTPKLPARLAMPDLIEGLKEGLKMMTTGGKRRFWIPEKLAYKGARDMPHGLLVFEAELVDIVSFPQAPKYLKRPPPNAKKLRSGLAFRVLEKGSGAVKPKAKEKVRINYTGWNASGNVVETSLKQQFPVIFPLNTVMPGWTEGIQLMTVGETRRFWIPEKLAFQGREGAPKGMLIYDIKLLEINPKEILPKTK